MLPGLGFGVCSAGLSLLLQKFPGDHPLHRNPQRALSDTSLCAPNSSSWSRGWQKFRSCGTTTKRHLVPFDSAFNLFSFIVHRKSILGAIGGNRQNHSKLKAVGLGLRAAQAPLYGAHLLGARKCWEVLPSRIATGSFCFYYSDLPYLRQ